MLDAFIAIAFGLAYWQASDRHLFACYVWLSAAGVLILIYNLTPDRRALGVVLPHTVLASLFVFLAWLATRTDGVTWAFATISWVPVLWYAGYVLTLANRIIQPSQSAAAG